MTAPKVCVILPRTAIASVHSYRGGTSKSNITANLAALLAADGKRVGVIDTDIQTPRIHILFGLDVKEVRHSLNDHLKGACRIEAAAYDVTARLGRPLPSAVFVIPSSMKAGDIARRLAGRRHRAVNAAYFLSNQSALGITVYLDDVNNKRFTNFLRVWKMMDLESFSTKSCESEKGTIWQRFSGIPLDSGSSRRASKTSRPFGLAQEIRQLSL